MELIVEDLEIRNLFESVRPTQGTTVSVTVVSFDTKIRFFPLVFFHSFLTVIMAMLTRLGLMNRPGP